MRSQPTPQITQPIYGQRSHNTACLFRVPIRCQKIRYLCDQSTQLPFDALSFAFSNTLDVGSVSSDQFSTLAWECNNY